MLRAGWRPLRRAPTGYRAETVRRLPVVPRLFSSSSAPQGKVLVVADHDEATLSPATLPVVTAASMLGDSVDILVAGGNCDAVAEQASAVSNVSTVVTASHPSYAHLLPETVAPLVAHLVKEGGYTHCLAPSTTSGKNYLPRVAALLDISPVTDILEVISADTFKRAIYAGNAIETVKVTENVVLASVRTTAFDKAETGNGTASISTSSFDVEKDDGFGLSNWLKDELVKSERPELTSANIVVSGGRGVKSKENFDLIVKFADTLNAAVGASRAAVDAGYAPNDWQVGQTGKVVAPDLYIAVGISGQIQHLAGMKDSKCIVAVNNAPDAPIFQVSDYGLVQDLFVAVPELTEKLSK